MLRAGRCKSRAEMEYFESCDGIQQPNQIQSAFVIAPSHFIAKFVLVIKPSHPLHSFSVARDSPWRARPFQAAVEGACSASPSAIPSPLIVSSILSPAFVRSLGSLLFTETSYASTASMYAAYDGFMADFPQHRGAVVHRLEDDVIDVEHGISLKEFDDP